MPHQAAEPVFGRFRYFRGQSSAAIRTNASDLSFLSSIKEIIMRRVWSLANQFVSTVRGFRPGQKTLLTATRLIGRIATDRGLLAVILTAIPVTWFIMEPIYDRLENNLLREVLSKAPVRSGTKSPAEATRSSKRYLPLESSRMEVTWQPGEPYLVRKDLVGTSAAPAWHTPELSLQTTRIDNIGKFKVAILPDGARPTPEFTAKGNASYEREFLQIELNLVHTTAGKHLVLDAGVQKSPGVWVKLPWWTFEGASKTNELLSVTRHAWIPAIRNVSMPTTMDAFSVWLKQNFHSNAKSVCPDFGKVGCLTISQTDFERHVVPAVEEAMAAEIDSLGAMNSVFRLSVVGGLLQWLMVHCLVAAILTALCRLLAYLFAERRHLRRARQFPDQYSSAEHLQSLQREHRRVWGVRSLIVEMHQAFFTSGLSAARDIQQRIASERCNGNRSLGEFAAQLNFYGLLGTLFFIAIGMSSMRLHPNPAVTSAALTAMTVTMGQSFYTTIVSATLTRVVAWIGVWMNAADDDLGRQTIDQLEDSSIRLHASPNPASRWRIQPVTFARGVAAHGYRGMSAAARIMTKARGPLTTAYRVAVGLAIAFLQSSRAAIRRWRRSVAVRPAGNTVSTSRLMRIGFWVLAFICLGLVASLWRHPATASSGSNQGESVLDILKKGGPLALPLAGCAFFALYLAMDRLIVIRRCCLMPRALVRHLRRIAEGRPVRVDRLVRLSAKSRSPLAALVTTAAQLKGQSSSDIEKTLGEVGRREFGAIDRKTQWLATIASLAPMFGLAGTVEGMIVTFRTMSLHGNGDPSLMAGGIYVSLVCTLFGILVAIPCVAIHRLFTSKIDELHDDAQSLLSPVTRGLE